MTILQDKFARAEKEYHKLKEMVEEVEYCCGTFRTLIAPNKERDSNNPQNLYFYKWPEPKNGEWYMHWPNNGGSCSIIKNCPFCGALLDGEK